MIWPTRICNPWLTLRLPPAPPRPAPLSLSLLLCRFADVLFLLFFTLLFFFIFALQVSSGSLSPVRQCSVVCGVLIFLSRLFFLFYFFSGWEKSIVFFFCFLIILLLWCTDVCFCFLILFFVFFSSLTRLCY